jgi:putative ABC transport system permease protein
MVNQNYAAIARLKPGVAIGVAETEFNQILRGLTGMPSKDFEVSAELAPLQTEMTGRVRQGLIVLMLAVGAVLLIVCVNITSLLLTQGTGRTRELAVRTALGASWLRLCLMLLAESLVLSIAGAAGGVLVAYWLLDIVRVHLPVGLPRIDEVVVDVTALLFACTLTVICTVACGLVPAWRLSKGASANALKDGGRGTISSRGAGRLRGLLIAGEVAVCVVLLVSAGLLMNSFVRIARIDQGFRSSNVFVAEADLPGARYPNPQARLTFFQQVLERAAGLPGMEAVGAASKLPLTGVSEVVFILAEGDPTPVRNAPQAEYRIVSPGYFAAMSIPVLRGRIFDNRRDGAKVAVIGESTAKRIWPGQDPVGRRFRGLGDQIMTVVGVVASVRSTAPNSEPPLTVYVPMAQQPRNAMTFVMRTSGREPAIRQAVKEVDPQLPLSRIAKVDEIVAASTAARRFQVLILSAFAGAALFLACLGIFGVVSFAVAQRRPELGLRLALGAQTSDVMGLVLRDGLKPVIAGAVAGLIGTFAATRLISSMLYGVTPSDPLTYSLATATLLMVAALACWLPARGALRIDPIATLRAE